MRAPLLAMSGASARRGAFTLGPIDLEVAAGETVALLGRNGSGKSSALALAVGELSPEAGSVRLGGEDVWSLSRPRIARAAVRLRQAPPPVFACRALDLVLHGRWVHGRGLHLPSRHDLEVARACLERVGGSLLADRDVRTLSGGEAQRVLLAKALAQESPLLLLDEPTASLDLSHRVAVAALAARLASDEARGVVLVTHDLDVAASACRRAVVLDGGRVVASGPVEDVFREDLLEGAFGVSVRVDAHPDTGRPRVTPSWRS